MLSEYVGDRAIIMPIMDHPSDYVWSNNLDNMIKMICPFDEVTLLCGRDGFNEHYFGKYETKELDFGTNTINLAATHIRYRVAQAPGTSEEFRNGVIYASQHMYPRVQPTVDIAVYKIEDLKTEDKSVLLARKPGRDKWCFVGGFVDGSDKSLEDAALRECQEETGITPGRLKYVCSHPIDDWRNTSSNSIMTTFFMAPYIHGHAQANDDIEEVKWFSVADMMQKIADHHLPLAEKLRAALAMVKPNFGDLMKKEASCV
jgi:bifunctional NMN adenylyltransferase/nudix hydrolase